MYSANPALFSIPVLHSPCLSSSLRLIQPRVVQSLRTIVHSRNLQCRAASLDQWLPDQSEELILAGPKTEMPDYSDLDNVWYNKAIMGFFRSKMIIAAGTDSEIPGCASCYLHSTQSLNIPLLEISLRAKAPNILHHMCSHLSKPSERYDPICIL